MVKFLIFLVVLIPTLISALLFFIAHALFTVPDVLFGPKQKVVAVLCTIGGVLSLIPAVAALFVVVFNSLGYKKTKKKRGNL